MKSGKLVLALGLVVIVVGCEGGKNTIEERSMPQKNPTTYEFDASLDAVKAAITAARGEGWNDAQLHGGGELAWKKDGNPFASKVFEDPRNENDAYLGIACYAYAVGNSQMYLKDGNELSYYADFQIHLTQNGASRTRVEIIAKNSRVLAGTESHPFARAGIFLDVDPTSIEDYQILLDIGKQLGDRDMPKLILPDLNSPTHTVKKPRSH